MTNFKRDYRNCEKCTRLKEPKEKRKIPLDVAIKIEGAYSEARYYHPECMPKRPRSHTKVGKHTTDKPHPL